MTINKFQGKTEEEAIEKAKSEMGQGLVIMNVRVVKPKGLFGFLKTPYYEVTAAMEDKEQSTVASHATTGVHRSIDLAADEQINLPKPGAAQPSAVRQVVPPVEPISEAARAVGDILNAHAAQQQQAEPVKTSTFTDTDVIEERLENLQQFLEKKLTDDASSKETGKEMEAVISEDEESVRIFRMLYRTLLDNEVDEVYINQLLDDVMKVARKGSSMDFILSHVYQKMILIDCIMSYIKIQMVFIMLNGSLVLISIYEISLISH